MSDDHTTCAHINKSHGWEYPVGVSVQEIHSGAEWVGRCQDCKVRVDGGAEAEPIPEGPDWDHWQRVYDALGAVGSGWGPTTRDANERHAAQEIRTHVEAAKQVIKELRAIYQEPTS